MAIYESSVWFDAASCAGVRFRVARITVTRRIELAKRIREAGRRLEFLEAGTDPREKLEAAVLASEIDRVYLEWALEAVEGIEIDGEAATPALVIDKGPMELAREILRCIQRECGLNEDERKN